MEPKPFETGSLPGAPLAQENSPSGEPLPIVPPTEPANVAADETEAFFRGVVSRITFRNEETGFGVYRVEPDPDKSPGEKAGRQPFGPALITVVGVAPPSLSNGTHIIARGEWQTHNKFGKQFRARSITEAEPTGREAIERYLASGAVKGFGPVLAQRIVERFGEQALAVLDKEPERLLEVPGVGEKKFQELREAWQQKRNLREVLLFFQTHNISLSLAQRIYNTYGDAAIERVSRNPYVLARDVWGIGFQTADRIATALNVSPTSPERIIAGLLYTLRRSGDDGHCFLPRDQLLAKAGSLLTIDDDALLESGLAQAIAANELVQIAERCYQPALYEAEERASELLAARLVACDAPTITIDPALVEKLCLNPPLLATHPEGFQLSAQQQEAIRLAASQTMVVITGGPGCGKTTVVRTIAALFRRAGLTVQLGAPTGRAAQRLSEVCDMKASTIHRLLKFDPVKRSFLHDEDTPLPVDALIVDESSMIDVPLAASLLAAMPPRARLIVVGDADQLPSVGPGLFLADLLSIPHVPRVRLSTLFRRADESLITQVAHQINAAIVPDIPEPDGVTKTDAYFLPAADAAEAAQLIERLVVDQIPKRFGLRGHDVMVLTPMNQGELGVIALNARLQAQLVPEGEGMPHVKVGNLEFRLGDRVCQRVNNYQLGTNGVFNGDQGEIVGIDVEQKSLRVRLWDGREIQYPSDALWQLDLAYALTIHRSQGSEVPGIVLALHESHSILLERQLLYTAVTRAKRLLIVVGTRKALATATKRSRSKRRYTALAERTAERVLEARGER